MARTLLPHSSDFSAVAMLNVSGKDQVLRHDMQIGIATPCQTDYVGMATDTDVTCVGARQHGADENGAMIDTVRCPNCQTVSKLGSSAVRDGPLADLGGPSADRDGPLTDRCGPLVDRDRPLADQDGPLADQDGPSAGRDGLLADRGGPSAGQGGPLAYQGRPSVGQGGPLMDRDGQFAGEMDRRRFI